MSKSSPIEPVSASDVSQQFRDPGLYLNEEPSQLDFNFRVLAQALDEQVLRC